MASTPVAVPRPIRFGEDYEVDLRPRRLRRGSRVLKLERIPLEILILLLEHRGEIVTRDQIVSRIWGQGVFLDTDNSIRGAIRKLRQILKDDAQTPRFIETVTGQGYRFVAPIIDPEQEHRAAASGVRPAAAAGGMPNVVSELDSWLQTRGLRIEEEDTKRETEESADARNDRGPRIRHFGRWLVLGGVALLALLAVAYIMTGRRAADATAPKIKSLAVLPLENLSGDKEQDYFADGMTDQLITDLGKVSALRVISRTSTMQYRGAREPLPEIARKMDVDAVVEGTVLRSGNRVRITAQLIRAVPEQHLWAESYDRDLRDVLLLQEEVARAIASQVQTRLTPQERTRLTVTHTPSPDAQEAYLKGQYFLNELSDNGVQRAIEYFNQAVERDSRYASPYVGLAQGYYGLEEDGSLPPQEAFAKIKEAAAKAIALDDSLGDAHTLMGAVYTYNDWDFNRAERELRLALELSPNSVFAHEEFSAYLLRMGKRDEAFAEMAKARALDPVSTVKCEFGFFLYLAREDDEAIEIFRLANTDPAHYGLALEYLHEGKNAEAIKEFERSQGGSDEIDTKEKAAKLRQAYKEGGMRGYWKRHLQLLMTESKKRYIRPLEFAFDYTMLGEKEPAFEWLEKAFQEHYSVVDLGLDRRFDSLHSDPRFQELMHRIGLPFVSEQTRAHAELF